MYTSIVFNIDDLLPATAASSVIDVDCYQCKGIVYLSLQLLLV